MATTIINPAANTSPSESSNGIGFLIGAIFLFAIIILFFYFALPFMRGFSGGGKVQVNVPVPKSINVNVQQSK